MFQFARSCVTNSRANANSDATFSGFSPFVNPIYDDPSDSPSTSCRTTPTYRARPISQLSLHPRSQSDRRGSATPPPVDDVCAVAMWAPAAEELIRLTNVPHDRISEPDEVASTSPLLQPSPPFTVIGQAHPELLADPPGGEPYLPLPPSIDASTYIRQLRLEAGTQVRGTGETGREP